MKIASNNQAYFPVTISSRPTAGQKLRSVRRCNRLYEAIPRLSESAGTAQRSHDCSLSASDEAAAAHTPVTMRRMLLRTPWLHLIRFLQHIS
jgi:hypothetical protein